MVYMRLEQEFSYHEKYSLFPAQRTERDKQEIYNYSHSAELNFFFVQNTDVVLVSTPKPNNDVGEMDSMWLLATKPIGKFSLSKHLMHCC